MRLHYFRYIVKVIFFISFATSALVHAEAKQQLLKVMDQTSFNKLWDQSCRDIGERPLLPYLLPPAETKKQGIPPVTFLKTGVLFLVSDNFYKLGLKCYRDQSLKRVIIQKGSYFPTIIAPPIISKLPPDRSIYSLAVDAYRDFLISDIQHKVYATMYLTRMKYTPTDEQVPFIFLFFLNNGVMNVLKHDFNADISIYELSMIKKDTYIGKLISPRSDMEDIFFPDNLQFKFTPKGLMTKMQGEKKFYFSDYINNKPFAISPPNDLGAQILFIPISNNQEKNIAVLVQVLSKNFNRFLDLYATNKLSDPDASSLRARKKWLLNWINQSGYLTTESGKKVKMKNIKRLEIWIRRYLSKHHIKLIKGKKYYFSRSLSHYMVMDYYKASGKPIFKDKPANPCLRYKHLDPNICDY